MMGLKAHRNGNNHTITAAQPRNQHLFTHCQMLFLCACFSICANLDFKFVAKAVKIEREKERPTQFRRLMKYLFSNHSVFLQWFGIETRLAPY